MQPMLTYKTENKCGKINGNEVGDRLLYTKEHNFNSIYF